MLSKLSKKFISVFLCITLILTYLPVAVSAAGTDGITRAADASTMDGWRDIFFPDGTISTENAGMDG